MYIRIKVVERTSYTFKATQETFDELQSHLEALSQHNKRWFRIGGAVLLNLAHVISVHKVAEKDLPEEFDKFPNCILESTIYPEDEN